MKRHFYLFSLLLFPALLQAQYRLQSKSGSAKKMVITTKYDPGFVELKNGTRLEGDIAIKVVNTDTVEIRFKSEDGKEKYPRSEVAAFGLDAKSGDEIAGKERKDPIRNLQPGYAILADGSRIEGKFALRNKSETGIPANDKKDYYIYENEVDGAREFGPDGVNKIVQVVEGKEITHYGFGTVLVQEQANGGLVYVRNPFPTTYNKMATMVAQQAAADANEGINETARKEGATVEGGGVDVDKVYYKEYLVKMPGDEDWTTITRDNYKDLVPKLLDGCKIEKQFMKYRYIYKAFEYYAANCGN